MKVYITEGSPMPIKRQLKSENYQWGNTEFVFSGNEQYDFLVTIDSLPYEIETNVDKNHRFLFLGEPPFVKYYNSSFLEQYGHVYGCNKSLIAKGLIQECFPVLPWMIGCELKAGTHECIPGRVKNYNDFANMSVLSEGRKNKACLITSRKVVTKGHKRRVSFADYVLENHADIIDVYGNGYQSIPDKYDVLSQYKYAIIIENCSYPNYWTEKIGDCFLAGCFPFYYGCKNILDYYPSESIEMIDINKMERTIEIVRSQIQKDIYSERIPAIIEAKEMVLNDYNMFSVINNKIVNAHVKIGEQSKESTDILKPLKYGVMDVIKYRLGMKCEIVF